MISNGFYGNTELELSQGTTVMQKAHQKARDGFYQFNKAILVLRNPLEAIITFRHMNFARKVKRANETHFQGFLWELHVYKGLVEWVQHSYSWLCRGEKRLKDDAYMPTRPENLNVVYYEHLVEKPGQGNNTAKGLLA